MNYEREKEGEICIVYRSLIIEMLDTIKDEKFLRSIYIILKTHISRSKVWSILLEINLNVKYGIIK